MLVIAVKKFIDSKGGTKDTSANIQLNANKLGCFVFSIVRISTSRFKHTFVPFQTIIIGIHWEQMLVIQMLQLGQTSCKHVLVDEIAFNEENKCCYV
jgi:hypothetical protein